MDAHGGAIGTINPDPQGSAGWNPGIFARDGHDLMIIAMWVAMVAMMAPWIRYNVRFVAKRSQRRRRTRAGLEVFAAWVAVWLFALVPIALASRLMIAGLGGTGSIVVVAAVAAVWQNTRWKRRALARCDLVTAPPLVSGAAKMACLALGVRLGMWCVISDWALMLIMGTAQHHPVAVVGLLGVGWFERFRLPHHDRRSLQTGLTVAACGVGALTASLVVGQP